jgi:ankyrin repeat protein
MPAAALFLAAAAAHLPGKHANGPEEALFPIIEALVNDNETAVEEQLAAGADLNVLDVITPLYACQEYVRNNKKRHKLLRRLLRAGALPDMETLDGSTTLMLAAYHGDVRSVQLLLDHGADPLKKNKSFGCGDGCDSIDAAIKGRHYELAEMLRESLGESAARERGAPPPEPKQEL